MKEPFCLVAWWGSFQRGGETVGDLRALEFVAGLAREVGFSVGVATIAAYEELSDYVLVDWREVDPATVQLLIFVCGPLIGGAPEFRNLIARFEESIKVAAGVSVLAGSDGEPWCPFDFIVARDGMAATTYGDMSNFSQTQPQECNDFKRIGLCLRGAQREYGLDSSLHETAHEIALCAASALGGEIVFLDTKLHGMLGRAGEVESAFLDVDAVITSRMHGALLGIAKGKPTLAIDQIKGGAKVSAVVGDIGWPAVICVDESVSTLQKHIAWLRSPEVKSGIILSQHAARSHFSRARQRLDDLLTQIYGNIIRTVMGVNQID